MKAILAASPLSLSIAALSMAVSVQAQAMQSEVELPAGEILQAARTIVSQTGPAYQVAGDLFCWSYAREFPPYGSINGCELTIEDKKTEFQPSRDLLMRLMKATPSSGPYYETKVAFKAESVSQEFPPYLVFERAVAIVF